MKTILKLLTVILFTVSMSTWADISSTTIGGAGWDKLTAAQQAEILAKVTTTVDKNEQAERDAKAAQAQQLADPNKIDEWVTLGQHIGQAFGGAAREVGVAANEFVTTPVGTLTIVLIIWHFVGNVLVHVFGGAFVFFVGMGLIYWHSRAHRETTDTYDPANHDMFGRSRRISHVKDKMDEGWATAYYAMGFITIIVSIITIFTY